MFGQTSGRQLGIAALLLLLVLLVSELGLHFKVAAGLDRAWFDLWHQLAGQRFVAQRVSLVLVDDATLAEQGDEPLAFWTPRFARAVQVLREAGVQVVGLDFLFALAPERWFEKHGLSAEVALKDFDLPIRQEIASGQLVLVSARTPGERPGEDGLLLPHQEYLLAVPDFDFARHLAYADVREDDDGAVRRFHLRPQLKLPADLAAGPLPVWSLPALLAERAGSRQEVGPDSADERLITYAGPPGSFPRLSMATLLRADALTLPAVQALKGKVVIIGGDYQGMNDVHVTPYTARFLHTTGARWMAGVEIQANATETLLAGRTTTLAGSRLRLLLVGLVAALLLLVWLNRPPMIGAAALLAGCVLLALFAWGLFGQFVFFPLGHAQLGLIAGFVGSLGLRLTREARQRAHMRQLFGRYVSDAVVTRLLASGKLPDLGGQTTRITVLFSDIRNFTSISEKLGAHEVVEMLNRYFQGVCEIILDEGGTIDKFIGDAVMVQFGAPVAMPDQALRALRVAVRMQDEASRFAGWMGERFAGRDLPPFAIGIGVHTGDAVVGTIGSTLRSEFTAIGDTVNTASRLEGQTKDVGCGILASAVTVNEALATAPGDVRIGRCVELHVKGRLQAVGACEILGLIKEN